MGCGILYHAQRYFLQIGQIRALAGNSPDKQTPKSLIVNDLRGPGRRNPLLIKDLGLFLHSRRPLQCIRPRATWWRW